MNCSHCGAEVDAGTGAGSFQQLNRERLGIPKGTELLVAAVIVQERVRVFLLGKNLPVEDMTAYFNDDEIAKLRQYRAQGVLPPAPAFVDQDALEIERLMAQLGISRAEAERRVKG